MLYTYILTYLQLNMTFSCKKCLCPSEINLKEKHHCSKCHKNSVICQRCQMSSQWLLRRTPVNVSRYYVYRSLYTDIFSIKITMLIYCIKRRYMVMDKVFVVIDTCSECKRVFFCLAVSVTVSLISFLLLI